MPRNSMDPTSLAALNRTAEEVKEAGQLIARMSGQQIARFRELSEQQQKRGALGTPRGTAQPEAIKRLGASSSKKGCSGAPPQKSTKS